MSGNKNATRIEYNKWITKADVPNNKLPTYAQLVFEIQIKKEETHRTRLTVIGDKID